MKLSRSVMPVGALMCAVIACTEDAAQAPPLLVVQAAVQQPATDELGIIALIQSRGGSWLEVELAGGTLADRAAAACLPAPSNEPLSQSITSVLVFPKQREAVITVRLFPAVPSSNPDDAGEGGAGTGGAPGRTGTQPSGNISVPAFPRGACGFDVRPLREVTKPISRAAAPVIPGSGGTGNGGTGGIISGGGGSLNGGTGGAVIQGGTAGDGAAGDDTAGQGGAA